MHTLLNNGYYSANVLLITPPSFLSWMVLDIASKSIEQARERYRTMRNAPFEARFHAMDCYSEPISNVVAPDVVFDMVSMQFCLHYSFETETKARMMLHNVTSQLKPGGVFIGTIPDAYWIV